MSTPRSLVECVPNFSEARRPEVIEGWTPVLLGIVAASMIYVAVADLIPGLHRRTSLRATLSQTTLIALGIGSIALARALLEGLA